MKEPNFKFANERPAEADDVYVVHVGRDISTKHDLIDDLASKLNTPAYFGRNWDSLLDILRDLGWIEQERVKIFHAELPKLDHESLKTYLEVLNSAVNHKRRDGRSRLEVIFPTEVRMTASSLV